MTPARAAAATIGRGSWHCKPAAMSSAGSAIDLLGPALAVHQHNAAALGGQEAVFGERPGIAVIVPRADRAAPTPGRRARLWDRRP